MTTVVFAQWKLLCDQYGIATNPAPSTLRDDLRAYAALHLLHVPPDELADIIDTTPEPPDASPDHHRRLYFAAFPNWRSENGREKTLRDYAKWLASTDDLFMEP